MANPAPAPAVDPTPPAPAGADGRWVLASKELRSTAKWVITALAAVAAVVFGAGPVITKPDLDFHDDRAQLLLAGVLGVAGLVGIAMLIMAVSKVLLPIEMGLEDLPEQLRAKIASEPDTVLPGGVPTLQAFRDRLAALRTAVVQIPDAIRDQEQLASDAQASGDSRAYAAAQDGIAAYQVALADNQASLATYESVRADLIDRGAYTRLSQVFSSQSKLLWTGALLGGIGGLGFQLALTSAPDGDDAAAAPDYSGVAMLSSSGARAAEFWDDFGLSGCETSEGQAPVFVSGGAGTADDPYVVHTVPDLVGADATCPAIEFVAHPDVFHVVVPEPQKVEIEVEDDDITD